jgi:uncharacterized membrane protein YkvA (DUF1232 family)
MTTWRARARRLKADLTALGYACRDPRVPWYAKAIAVCVVAYALSPVDLIPDPIPVLGYVDDMVLLPLGILLVVWMVPPDVMAECRERARVGGRAQTSGRWVMAGIIVALWAAVAVVVARALWRWAAPG